MYGCQEQLKGQRHTKEDSQDSLGTFLPTCTLGLFQVVWLKGGVLCLLREELVLVAQREELPAVWKDGKCEHWET